MAPEQNNNQNPYAFLYQTPQTPKKTWLPSGKSTQQRVIIVLVSLVVLILLVYGVFGLLLGGRDQTKPVVELAQTQAELIRVSTIGTTKSTGLEARALATTIQLSLTTAQSSTLSYLKKHGQKLNDKQLAVAKNTSTDQTLNQAALNNNFDSTFTTIMHDKLLAYQQALQKAYNGTKSLSQKQLLKQLYDQTTTLLGQKTTT